MTLARYTLGALLLAVLGTTLGALTLTGSPAPPPSPPPAAPPPQFGTWNNHAWPFSFLFGNHMDTHQQTVLLPNGELIGFLYIKYTGRTTASGLQIATHPDENTPASEFAVGWILRG